MIIRTCLFLAMASPAFAQSPDCAPRPDFVAGLLRNYGETSQAEGLAAQGVVEVYSAPSGTWTVTITLPNGLMCLVASGDQYHAIPQGVAG